MVDKNLFINPSVCIPIYKSDLNELKIHNEYQNSQFDFDLADNLSKKIGDRLLFDWQNQSGYWKNNF